MPTDLAEGHRGELKVKEELSSRPDARKEWAAKPISGGWTAGPNFSWWKLPCRGCGGSYGLGGFLPRGGLGSGTRWASPALEPDIPLPGAAAPGVRRPYSPAPVAGTGAGGPQLHVVWDERLGQVHLQLMGSAAGDPPKPAGETVRLAGVL